MTYEAYESFIFWKKKFQPSGKKEKISTLHVQKKKMMQNLLVYADRWQQMEGKRAPK